MPITVDATVTAVVDPTSSSDEEQADVTSHPLPDMFGAQVSQTLHRPLWVMRGLSVLGTWL